MEKKITPEQQNDMIDFMIQRCNIGGPRLNIITTMKGWFITEDIEFDINLLLSYLLKIFPEVCGPSKIFRTQNERLIYLLLVQQFNNHVSKEQTT